MKPPSYQRFMILSTPRSGTHMLRTALNMHAAIAAKTEMFNPDWTAAEPFSENTPEQVILDDHIFCEHPPAITAVGFILHRSDARGCNRPELWEHLASDTGLRIISLRRQNLLRRFLSYQAMRDRQQRRAPSARHLDPDKLRAEFERQETEVAAFDRLFEAHPLMKLSYEQLCSNYSPTIRRIQLFIDAPFAPIIPGTRRNPPAALEQLVSNLDELVDVFAGSRWSWFFREEHRASRFRAGVDIGLGSAC